MRVLFLLSVISTFEAYALSSQAQDKPSLLINHLKTIQSDTIVVETSPVAKSKRRISYDFTGIIQDGVNSVRVAHHKSNAFQEDAQNMKTADTSVHQLRGGNSRKPEESKARHLTTSKAGGDVGSIGTVTGQRRLNSMHDIFNTRIDEWELQDWLLALVLLLIVLPILVQGTLLASLPCFLWWEICCDPSPGGANYRVIE